MLTLRPVPTQLPEEVTAAASASELLGLMRGGDFTGDVHLVGGPRTIQAFRQIDALERLEVDVLPIQLHDGVPLSAPGTEPIQLGLESQRSFANGSLELAYSLESSRCGRIRAAQSDEFTGRQES